MLGETNGRRPVWSGIQHRLVLQLAIASIVGAALAVVPAEALEVWSGRTLSFARPNFSDWNQAQFQDRITPNVWITRKNTMGIFNIAQELGYSALSPADTEWATGNAADHASLAFRPWVQWAGNNPPATVGVDAVVHLISEDIYIDIRFDSWTILGKGGGFSYTRGEPTTTSVEPGLAAFSLRGFLANPARRNTQIEFALPDAAPARLEVFDLAGRRLASREVGSLGGGAHRIRLDELQAAPPGLLFVRLSREDRTLVARGARLL